MGSVGPEGFSHRSTAWFVTSAATAHAVTAIPAFDDLHDDGFADGKRGQRSPTAAATRTAEPIRRIAGNHDGAVRGTSSTGVSEGQAIHSIRRKSAGVAKVAKQR